MITRISLDLYALVTNDDAEPLTVAAFRSALKVVGENAHRRINMRLDNALYSAKSDVGRPSGCARSTHRSLLIRALAWAPRLTTG